MEALAKAGAAGFTDDGIPIMDEKILVQAMEKAKELDLPVSLHEEDPAFIASPGVHQGEVSRQLGYGGASRTAEDVMVAQETVHLPYIPARRCAYSISAPKMRLSMLGLQRSLARMSTLRLHHIISH